VPLPLKGEDFPLFPKLRPLDLRWVSGPDGRSYLTLRDPLRLARQTLLIPADLAPLLGLMDGSRDIPTLCAAFTLRTGLPLSVTRVQALVAQLERALLLEGPRFQAAWQEALEGYRRAPYRPPAMAGTVYPPDPEALERLFRRAWEGAGGDSPPTLPLRGILSPHIDYQRGLPVYAKTWGVARPALQDVETVVVLGTDHQGRPGGLTLTRQHYATPWGVLPTDATMVDALAEVLTPDAAFAQELHHAGEHSIELAVVWLHYALGGRSVPLLPVLCGPLSPSPAEERRLEAFITTLQALLRGKRWVVVAAGDLAHVGPAFGDTLPYDLLGKARLKEADLALLDLVARGDAEGFLRTLQEEQDRRKVCGLSCIYLALRLLGKGVQGHLVDYAQCPADERGTSVVSIAGLLWRARPPGDGGSMV
jgi:AmmeMemoRadiSam system protein B